jgi:chemotaxis protein CheD
MASGEEGRGRGELDLNRPQAFDNVSRDSFYLHPANVFVAPLPYVVTTILGSCVAIFLWDAGLGLGGLNHYLLPHWAKPGDDALRFGNVALWRLLSELEGRGARKDKLQAKLFGGACVLPTVREEGHLGAKNVEVAREMLGRERIPVVAEDVGGRRGRKLVVHTDTGDAWVKLL